MGSKARLPLITYIVHTCYRTLQMIRRDKIIEGCLVPRSGGKYVKTLGCIDDVVAVILSVK